MARIIGTGPAERLLQHAVMLQPEEAKRLGLVDDLAPKEGLMVRKESDAPSQQ
jgi:enoyl-CoA hydratase/carnithine racemase